MIEIDFINEQDEVEISEADYDLLRKVVNTLAQLEELNKGEVAITLTDNLTIHKLNKEYRNIDAPTDVLSFPLEDEEGIVIEDVDYPLHYGDIIISALRAKEQATEFGHSLQRELSFLVAHGFLHLLGYDHETKEEEQVMFAKQEEVLQMVGINR